MTSSVTPLFMFFSVKTSPYHNKVEWNVTQCESHLLNVDTIHNILLIPYFESERCLLADLPFSVSASLGDTSLVIFDVSAAHRTKSISDKPERNDISIDIKVCIRYRRSSRSCLRDRPDFRFSSFPRDILTDYEVCILLTNSDFYNIFVQGV